MEQPTEKSVWNFDPQDAVNLLLGYRKEEFTFEFAISLYLLFIWGLWPTTTQVAQASNILSNDERNHRLQLRNTARCLSTVVTLTRMGKKQLPRAAQFKSIRDLVIRAKTTWFADFDEKFIAPLGGLRAQFIGSKNAKSRQKTIAKQWKNEVLLRDIVSYFCKVPREQPRFFSGKALIVALQEDLFNRGDYRERKRKKIISGRRIESTWESGLRTAALLYALQQKLPGMAKLDIAKPSFLKSLYEIARDRDKVANMLFYYKQITVILMPDMKVIPTLKRWAVIDIPGEVPTEIVNEVQRLEVFNEQERLKLQKTSSAIPNR
jgi:hypothetical protein